MINRCDWCKGVGKIKLIGHNDLICLNCHGSGKVDGDKTWGRGKTTGKKTPWLIGNQNWKKRNEEVSKLL